MDAQMMAAKAFLNQVYHLEQRVRVRMEEIARLRSLAMRTTSCLGMEPICRTRNVSSMEDIIHKLIMVEQEANDAIDEMINRKSDIMNVLSCLRDENARTILEMRYVGFMEWDMIAHYMHCSEASVFRQHQRGLQLVADVVSAREAG